MHAVSNYRGNRPTNTRRPPAANTAGPFTIHCAAASEQCIEHIVELFLPSSRGFILVVRSPLQNSKRNPISRGIKYRGCDWEMCYFRQKTPCMSQTVRHRPMVSMDHWWEVTDTRQKRITFEDLEWSWKARARGPFFQRICLYIYVCTLVPFDAERTNWTR